MKTGTAGFAVVVSVALALAGATPASAEVLGTEGGFTYVKKEETLPNGPGPASAEATAKCPKGAVHTGGGGSVTGKPAGTSLASSGTAAERQWYVEGSHTGINPKNETLTSWVICTERAAKITSEGQPKSAGPPPSGDNAVAECVEGHAVGGGVRTIGPASDWRLNSTGAVDTGDPGEVPDDGWVTWVDHPTGAIHNFIVDVICMTGNEPIYRDKQKVTNKKKATVKVKCPEGKSATGGGAFASDATDQAHVVSTAPIDTKKDADTVPDDGWKAKYYNDDSTGQLFTASVVCK